ncbi:MAG: hypothetical protein JW881_04570 [Spirochaetales bacterium]|nr:hypothetical protein [Spirochaetales bacterium]
MVLRREILEFKDYSIDTPKEDKIISATLLVLPFHLCTGEYFFFKDPENSFYALCLYNEIYFPEGTLEEDTSPQDIFTEKAYTRVLLINIKPDLKTEEFEAITNKDIQGAGKGSVKNQVLDLLNEFILSYSMLRTGPIITAGQRQPIHKPNSEDYMNSHITEFLIIIPKKHELSKAEIMVILNKAKLYPIRRNAKVIGDIIDLSEMKLNIINDCILKLRRHVFYEFYMMGKAAMLEQNYIVAIVLACAALEGALGTLLNIFIDDKLKDYNDPKHEILNNLLREQGLHTLIKLTPYLVLEKEERPSNEDIKLCIKGIEIRNDIMHAKKRKANDKIRTYDNRKMREGYNGIMKVYNFFVMAIEKDEENKT